MPWPGISMPHLVRITTSFRRPGRACSHSPIIASDSPPWWPGAQAEYTSAESMTFSPMSTIVSSRRKPAFRSTVQPNTLPPKITGGTSIPDLPRLRFCMACRSFS